MKRLKLTTVAHEIAEMLLRKCNTPEMIIVLCGKRNALLVPDHSGSPPENPVSAHEDLKAKTFPFRLGTHEDVEDKNGSKVLQRGSGTKSTQSTHQRAVKVSRQSLVSRRETSQSSLRGSGTDSVLRNHRHSARIPNPEHVPIPKNCKSENSLDFQIYGPCIQWPHGCPTDRVIHHTSKDTATEPERPSLDGNVDAKNESVFDRHPNRGSRNENTTRSSHGLSSRRQEDSMHSTDRSASQRKHSAPDLVNQHSLKRRHRPDSRPLSLVMQHAAQRAANRRRNEPPPASGSGCLGCNCAKCLPKHPTIPDTPLDCLAIKYAGYCDIKENGNRKLRCSTMPRDLEEDKGLPSKYRRQHYIDKSTPLKKRIKDEKCESPYAKYLRIFRNNAITRQVTEGNELLVDNHKGHIPKPTLTFIGLTRQKLMSIQFYNPRSEDWTFPLDLEVPFRQNFASVQHNGHLFVCGGEDENGKKLKTCFSYNIRTSKVVERCELRIARSYATATAYNHSIFVIGGKNSSDHALSSVEVLDHRNIGSKWRILKSMKEPHFKVGAATNSIGDFFVIGGYSTLCECYVDEEEAWRDFNLLPSRFSNHGNFCTIRNNKIYSFVDHFPREVAILDPVANVVYVTPTRGQPPGHIVAFFNKGDSFWAVDENQSLFTYDPNTYVWRWKSQLRNDLICFLSMTVVNEEEVPFIARRITFAGSQ